jgi:hypothetical protein
VVDRGAALAEFDRTRAEWEEAFARVPDEALGFLKPGDDYALGGLLVHVNAVLSGYLALLRAIVAADFQELTSSPPADAEAVAHSARRGLSPTEREPALAEMRRLHVEFRDTLASLDETDWSRTCAVVYGAGQDPLPTTPADILGWVRDHYREHVPHSAELTEEWRAATKAGG